MTAAKKLIIAGALGGAAYWYYLKLEQDRKIQGGQWSAESVGRNVDNAAAETRNYIHNKYEQGVDAAQSQKAAVSERLTEAQKNSEQKLKELNESAAKQKDNLVSNVDNVVEKAGDKSKGWIDSTVGWVTGKK